MSKKTGPTVCDRIFDNRYHVRIQQLYMYSTEHIEEYGLPTTGDPSYDDALMKQYIDCYRSIADMVELHSMGASVILVNMKQAGEIHGLLRQHLLNWKKLVETTQHKVNPPIDDLEMMESFATAIEPIAKTYSTTTEPVEGLASKFFGDSIPRRGLAKPARPSEQSVEEEVEQQTPAERGEVDTPVAEAIARSSLFRQVSD